MSPAAVLRVGDVADPLDVSRPERQGGHDPPGVARAPAQLRHRQHRLGERSLEVPAGLAFTWPTACRIIGVARRIDRLTR